MTNLTKFPTQARFIATREERIELTETLLNLIVTHLDHVEHQTEGRDNRDLRASVEAKFQGGSVTYGQKKYDAPNGETKFAKQSFLRFMWSSDPHASTLRNAGRFSKLGKSGGEFKSVAPDHLHSDFAPAQFDEALNNILTCNTDEGRKTWQDGEANVEQAYEAAVTVWSWLKNVKTISYYQRMGTRKRDGQTFLWPWPPQAIVDSAPDWVAFDGQFDAAKQGTLPIFNRPRKVSEEANEGGRLGQAAPARVFNEATGSHELVEESSHDAFESAVHMEDLRRRLSSETKTIRRQLSNFIG